MNEVNGINIYLSLKTKKDGGTDKRPSGIQAQERLKAMTTITAAVPATAQA